MPLVAPTCLRFGSCSWLLLLLACGCGRDAPVEAPEQATPSAVSSEPAAPAEREPRTLAEAEQLLEQARSELDRLAFAEPPPPAGATAGGAPSPLAPSAAPARDAAAQPEVQKRRADSAAQAETSNSDDRRGGCETACKAFSSLERASGAVCRLDVDGGQRCQRARQIREDAAKRVASCGCAKP